MKKSALAAALLFLLPITVAAQDNDISFFLGGAAFEKTTLVAFLPEDLEVGLTFENGRSFALGFNHFWGDGGISTEFGILGLQTDPTLEVSSGPFEASIDVGDISVAAFTTTAQYHFRRHERVSPYLGAGLAILTGEFEAEFPDEFGGITRQTADFEVGAGFLFNAGLDIRINERWIFGIDVKAIPYSPEIDADEVPEIPEEEIVVTDELDLNPVIVGLGARYRF